MYKSRQSIQNRHCVFSFEIKILGGSLMQIVEDFKYLGLWRDSNFTFKIHIDNIIRKVYGC